MGGYVATTSTHRIPYSDEDAFVVDLILDPVHGDGILVVDGVVVDTIFRQPGESDDAWSYRIRTTCGVAVATCERIARALPSIVVNADLFGAPGRAEDKVWADGVWAPPPTGD